MTSAVPLVNISNFADNLIALALTNEVGALIAEVIEDWKTDNPDYLLLELSTEDKNAMLKMLTGCCVATGTDLNCYPRGLVDTLCFDLSGEPIP